MGVMVMGAGSVFKKCGCREQVLGLDGVPVVDAAGKPVQRRLGAKCPKLHRGSGWNPRHGSWYFQYDHADAVGGRVTVGFAVAGDRVEAEAQLSAVRQLMGLAEKLGEDAVAVGRLREQIATRIKADHKAGLGLPDFDAMRRAVLTGQPIVERLTVGQWLTTWLAEKGDLAPDSRRAYAGHVRNYLIPYLGGITLERLRVGDITAMMDAIAKQAAQAQVSNAERRELVAAKKAAWRQDREAWRDARDRLAAAPSFQPVCDAATRARIRATLRSALSAARAQQLITINVAALADLPSGKAPKALVWTAERVKRWRATGERPSSVMVWTPEQTQVFLGRAMRHELRAVFFLLAFTGLRRGEAVGLRWDDVDLDARWVSINRQEVQVGWSTVTTAPKSESSERQVGLAPQLISELAAHRERQDAAQAAAGPAWCDTGLVFTRLDGTGIHPDVVSRQFRQLVREADLPPVRLHDLRHGAASIALRSGVDLKVVSDMLGHSSTAFTADVYTSVYTDLKHLATDAIARALTRPDRPDAAADAA
jgi:integrase